MLSLKKLVKFFDKGYSQTNPYTVCHRFNQSVVQACIA